MPARVFSVSSQGSLAVLTDLPSDPLLDHLLPGNLSLLASLEDPLALTAFGQTLKPLEPPSAKAYATVQRWVLGSGQTRDLKAIFGMMAGVIAKTVQIRDPYCLSSDENRRNLAAFIRDLWCVPKDAITSWVEVPPGQWSVSPVAGRRCGWVTGRIEALRQTSPWAGERIDGR